MCRLRPLLLLLLSPGVFSGNLTENGIEIAILRDVDSPPESRTIPGTPISYHQDLFGISIVNQSVPKLRENSVKISKELTFLRIVNSSLTEISAGAFNITPTLALVKITRNPLSKISKNVFNSLKVKEINLSNNQISVIDQEAFDNNSHLEILKLNNNLLKEINSDWFQKTPNLYKLTAIFNELQEIPQDAFKNLAQNRALSLNFSSNRITHIHAEFLGNHGNIDVLALNGNKLASLPDGLFVNKTIGGLHVDLNNLECFPETLFQNPSLQCLTLFDNIVFKCECLRKVKDFSEKFAVHVIYPSIICEDKKKEVNLVFNYNQTYGPRKIGLHVVDNLGIKNVNI